MVVAGTFAASVHTKLVVPGDAVKTATNILGSLSLFRLGILGSLVLYTAFIAYVVLLYRLLVPVGASHARMMLALALVGTSIALLNQVNQAAVLQLLSGEGYLKALPADQLYAQVMLFLRLHGQGNLIGVIFWGLWLFPLGLLVYRSGFFPKVLGMLLMIGCFGWLALFFQRFTLPDAEALASARYVAHLAELAWVSWLTIRGVNVERWEAVAGRAG
jgi:hypothetical protein